MEDVAWVRRGEITEIVGRRSSGRTSLFAACLRGVTRRGAIAALVDADQTFDPVSAARAGVDLRRLLWVRCGGRPDLALRAADLLVRCPGFALIGLDLGEAPPRLPLTLAFRLKFAVERTETALLAVVAPAPSVTRVVDANAAAREYGVRAGVTETEARARCPALVTRSFSEAHVRSARHALLEAALGVSPRVEDAGAGLVYVDAVGLTWLHGDPAAIGRRLVSQARAVGFPGCRVALAGSRAAARVAAVSAAEPLTVVPPGAERAALAGARLAALDLAPDLAATLEGWGVRTLGELAALPRDGLAVRP